jgi:hypothetical protein
MKKLPFLGLIAMTLFCNSCSRDIAYDSDYTKNQFEQNFISTFGEIDPLQDWKTIQNNKVTVAANFGGSEEYTVGIYQDDPLFNASKCGLLAMGKVTDGSSTSLTFDGAIAQSRYYAALFDSKGRSVATTFLASDEKVNFGGTATSAAKAMTRGIVSSSYAQTWSDRSGGLDPATMRTDDTYVDLITVPTVDLQKMTDSGNAGQFHGYKYIVKKGKTFTGSFAIQNGILFVDGTLDLSGTDNLVFNRSKLVISSTGKVILHKDVSMTEVGTQLLIEAGGQLVSDGNYTFVITNGGTSYSAGTISMPNGTFNYNGTNLYNCGNISVKYLYDSSQGGTLTNFGQVTAYANDPNDAGAYNCKYINCCYMKFDHCGMGNFTLTDNSRVDVTNRLFMTGTNSLGNMSEINAGEMKLQSATFNGPTGSGEFAIVKNTGKMYISWYGDGVFNNNVYIDWDKTKCCKYEGEAWDMTNIYWAGYQFVNNITNWSTESTSKLIIPAGTCTGTGYNPNGNGGDVPTAAPAYTIVFEDLGTTDDFDFNDIVLFVYPYTKSNKLKVVLVANGGTLKTDVKFGDTDLFTATGTMTNTTSPFDKKKVIAEKTIDLPNGFTISKDNYASQFKIVVNGTTSIEATTEEDKGKAPQVLIIPGEWSWPTERQNIGAAYPRFKNWVTDKTKDTDWYK